ncbi:putative terpenoid cyclases/protein prenyltransferase alpha-alpha toroid [Helianthus anomalus]
MWKLKIAEGNDPYLFTTNNFVGRQVWEFDPDAGTPEERQEVENARQNFLERKKEGFRTTCDSLMRIQVGKLDHLNNVALVSLHCNINI